MTVADLGERMSSREVAEWLAYFRVQAEEMDRPRDADAPHGAPVVSGTRLRHWISRFPRAR